MIRTRKHVLPVLAVLLLCTVVSGQSAPAQPGVPEMLAYIDKGWDVLTRSMDKCETVVDRRAPTHSLLYLPAGYPESPAIAKLARECRIKVEHLPQPIASPGSFDMSKLKDHGLLYLEHPYVVPGGFFNEMYGWDSYFIIRGLLRAGRSDLARGMVENFFFEIENYGAILNANRTYFLTRSQPPFLSSMVVAVRESIGNEQDRRAWLQKAYTYIDRDYTMWTSGEHLAGNTGLSRYYDFGQGPSPELIDHPYYRDTFRYLQAVPDYGEYLNKVGDAGVTGPEYTLETCEQATGAAKNCENLGPFQFTSDYYKGDRAMRESGFDISFRFGPFSGRTHHFAAVCLNSLLYKTETDMEQISRELGRNEDAKMWAERARVRKERMSKYLWNAQRGLFFDYDFMQRRLSNYEYLTTFYPLWAGLATPEQARAVVGNLKTFEFDGGLAMSPFRSGVQWDLPYGWAPVHLLAVEGMHRYGFHQDAGRVARKWMNTVLQNFRQDGTIREKYNVVSTTAETPVTAGYKQNVIGFGWTNGVVLEFASRLGMIPAKSSAVH